jgi:hypothetical protein
VPIPYSTYAPSTSMSPQHQPASCQPRTASPPASSLLGPSLSSHSSTVIPTPLLEQQMPYVYKCSCNTNKLPTPLSHSSTKVNHSLPCRFNGTLFGQVFYLPPVAQAQSDQDVATLIHCLSHVTLSHPPLQLLFRFTVGSRKLVQRECKSFTCQCSFGVEAPPTNPTLTLPGLALSLYWTNCTLSYY